MLAVGPEGTGMPGGFGTAAGVELAAVPPLPLAPDDGVPPAPVPADAVPRPPTALGAVEPVALEAAGTPPTIAPVIGALAAAAGRCGAATTGRRRAAASDGSFTEHVLTERKLGYDFLRCQSERRRVGIDHQRLKVTGNAQARQNRESGNIGTGLILRCSVERIDRHGKLDDVSTDRADIHVIAVGNNRRRLSDES